MVFIVFVGARDCSFFFFVSDFIGFHWISWDLMGYIIWDLLCCLPGFVQCHGRWPGREGDAEPMWLAEAGESGPLHDPLDPRGGIIYYIGTIYQSGMNPGDMRSHHIYIYILY